MEELEILKRKNSIIKTIIKERKDAAKKISKNLKIILDRTLNDNHVALRNKIIKERSENALKLQKYIKGFLIRKRVHEILIQNSTCFLIQSGLSKKDCKNLKMKIFLSKQKTVEMQYNDLLGKYIYFLERTRVGQGEYKVVFLVDGKKIIDPSISTRRERNGEVYNYINFDKIRKEELNYEIKKKREIRGFISDSKKRGHTYSSGVINTFNDEVKNNSNHNLSGDFSDTKLNRNQSNEIHRTSRKKLSTIRNQSNLLLKNTTKLQKVCSTTKLFKPKSILKVTRRNQYSSKDVSLLINCERKVQIDNVPHFFKVK